MGFRGWFIGDGGWTFSHNSMSHTVWTCFKDFLKTLWYFTNNATCPWLFLFCPWLSRVCTCLFRFSFRMSLIHLDSSFIYINIYNKLNLQGTMIWYIFQKNIWSKRTSGLCVNNVIKVIYGKKQHWHEKIHANVLGRSRLWGMLWLKGYYNTESRACTK